MRLPTISAVSANRNLFSCIAVLAAAACAANASAAAAAPPTAAELLAAAVVPPEFDATIFATPAEANYPVSIAAARRVEARRGRYPRQRLHAAPLISSLKLEDVLALVTEQRGSTSRGEQVYAQAACNACHTVNASDPLKGPFLGTIARIYPQRRDLAEAILDPNKSISQGFATYQFTLKNGTATMGFVTRESSDVVSLRDISGQQHELRVADVAKRERLPISLMPPGLLANFTVADFAALLDYLQSLAEAN